MKGSKIEIKTLKIELILLKLWGKNTKTRHFPLLRSMNWPEISLFKLHSFKRVCSEVFFKPTSRGRSPAPWDSILPWNLTSNFAHVKTGCFSNYLPLQTHSLKKNCFWYIWYFLCYISHESSNKHNLQKKFMNSRVMYRHLL